MGFLNKLWDETVAGPMPDSGLGKLRKYNSFNGSGSRSPSTAASGFPRALVPITRSITVLRRSNTGIGSPPRLDVTGFSPDAGSTPSSPVSSSFSPTSLFSPDAPGSGGRKLTRRQTNPAALQQMGGEPKSPTTSIDHDSYWIVLSAVDRT